MVPGARGLQPRWYERPIVIYLIIALFSFGAAVIFFWIGGSFAQVTGNKDTPLGVTFEAGGALAGFIIILLLSGRVVAQLHDLDRRASDLDGRATVLSTQTTVLDERETAVGTKEREIAKRQNDLDAEAREQRINMKLYLVGKPVDIERRSEPFTCKYWLYNEETGNRKEYSPNPRWEAGFLTLDVLKVGPEDLVSVRVEDASKDIWEADYFHPREHRTDVVQHAERLR